jgi:hypothetical protein
MSRKYTFFVLLRATKAWLALTRAARNQFVEHELSSLFAKYGAVSVRFYDTEAFTARCSDIAVFETAELQQYYFLMDGLRDSKVFTVPYFDLLEIIPAIEGGFIEYEESLQQG